MLKPALIVVEATGGYQRAVVLGLYEAGLPVAVVNPSGRMIEVLKKELDKFMKENEEWQAQEQILTSAKGVGRITQRPCWQNCQSWESWIARRSPS